MTDHSLTYRDGSIRNYVHRYRLHKILKLTSEISAQRPIRSFCDVGCSNGYISKMIKDQLGVSRACGMDHSDNIITAAECYPDIEFVRVNLNVPHKGSGAKFDLVTCFETLEHVGRLEAAIDNLLCLASQDGYILISVPIEHGLVGFLKYVIKTTVLGYDTSELGVSGFRYLRRLLSNIRISELRPVRDGFGTHFGFDYRDVDAFLSKLGVTYSAFNRLTTRFYIIKCSGVRGP